MLNFLKNIKKSRPIKVTDAEIRAAYDKRKTEIDSLKAYDRGEKDITPRNLRSAV